MTGVTLLCLLIAYLISSTWESWFHRKVLHANRRRRKKWRRYGPPGALLRLAYFYHDTIHHRQTFKRSFVVQFDELAQKEKLDAALKGTVRERLIANKYGTTVRGFWEVVALSGVPLILICAEFFLFSATWLPAGICVALMPFLVSRYIHPLLHFSEDHQAFRGRRLKRLIGKTQPFRYLQRYHLLHHKNRSINFNLVLGADWLFVFGKTRNRLRELLE